jgi:hypothetical protein
MLTADFDFDLPNDLIAQAPSEPRDHSRLMIIHRDTKQVEHRHFFDIVDYLKPGDVVVRNNSKVFKARLFGTPLIDTSKLGLALLDADNGGGVLDGNPTAAIKLDVTNVIENQLVEFRLYRKNGGQSIGFYNGTPGSEVFAKINHSSGGYVSIADTTTPTFDDTQDVCAVKLKYIQITTGVYRFVILEAVNFNY